MSPATSAVSAKIIRQAFDENEVAVFEGGVELANHLLELPVNHIFFTGSPAVGKQVMAAAAKHLASVTLELGGKNPVVVDRSADIADAAQKTAYVRALNNGQTCLCPETVWIPEESKDAFLAVVQATYQGAFYKGGELNEDAIERFIDERNAKRVRSYIEDAVQKGANLLCGGDLQIDNLSMHPAILTDVPDDAIILENEVFGPVLTVNTYKDIGEVIGKLQSQPKPLALYLFSNDETFIEMMLQKTSSGGVTINNLLMHCIELNLPFGGVNNSGIGRYHGYHGFKELSHERAVLYADGSSIL